MPRPRSVFGVLAATTAVWLLCSGDEASSPRRTSGTLQAAVLSDGFAVMETGGDRHVLEIDRDGKQRRRSGIPIATETRVVGTARGAAVGWLDGKKFKLALITGDGKLATPSVWGSGAIQLCEGVASNDHRFGIGWLQKDGRAWFVHGPTTMTATTPPDLDAMKLNWCGIASADDYIALFTREGTRTFFQMCTKKECASLIARVPVGGDQELLAFGCVRDGCAIAVRDESAKTKLGWISTRGKILWSKELRATSLSSVAIVGAGPRAIVVGYVSDQGATVERVMRDGSMVRAWADPYSHEVPALAWSNDQLLVAHRHGTAIAPELVPLPR